MGGKQKHTTISNIFAESTNSKEQPYKYNNKELDETLGLNVYDYLARQLELGVPRFTSMDPKAEAFYSWLPYTYCMNNPIIRIDPGEDSTQVYTETIDYGHAWMSVGEGEDVVVYSFGPFSEYNRKYALGQTLKGSGILVKYTGKEAEKYLNNKKEKSDMQSQTIGDVSDDDVRSVLEEHIAKGKVAYDPVTNKVSPNEGTSVYYNIGDTYGSYNAITNNCTNFVADVLKESGSKYMQVEVRTK